MQIYLDSLIIIPLISFRIAQAFQGIRYFLFRRLYHKSVQYKPYQFPLGNFCTIITGVTLAFHKTNIFEILILMCASGTMGMLINKIGNKI